MTMHKAFHLRDDVDRIYVSRKERGRGFASIEDSWDASKLDDYVEKRREWLITATRNDTNNIKTNERTITIKPKWEEKYLPVHFKRPISNISHEKTWTWLRKRETESLLIAEQNCAIRTIHIKARTDKMQQNSKCRLCCERNETVKHIICPGEWHINSFVILTYKRITLSRLKDQTF